MQEEPRGVSFRVRGDPKEGWVESGLWGPGQGRLW